MVSGPVTGVQELLDDLLDAVDGHLPAAEVLDAWAAVRAAAVAAGEEELADPEELATLLAEWRAAYLEHADPDVLLTLWRQAHRAAGDPAWG